MELIAQLLKEHYDNHPEMELQDAAKFLYQHYMGPGHLIPREEDALNRLQTEWSDLSPAPDMPLYEDLGNNLCRLNLQRCKADNLSPSLIARMFFLTAQTFRTNPEGLEQAVALLGSLPFSHEQTNDFLLNYRAQGFPAPSHTQTFRTRYHPSYRVISKYYVNILPALTAVSRAMETQRQLRVAIDGPCASGKSTLGAALSQFFCSPLIHMDDFFLRPEQRTPLRLAQPGGNVDYERFAREVLAPLLSDLPATYRPWLCQQGTFGPEITVEPEGMVIVEGCYCLRPDLRDAFHVRIWAHSSFDVRRERLLQRGGTGCLARFEQLWIPLEDQYFEHFQVADCCQVHLELC